MSSNENRPLIRRHIELEEVLQLATPDELVAIADILLDKANDRLLGDGSWLSRARFNTAFTSLLGPLGKLGLGAAGGSLLSGALGSVAAVGMLTALPLTAVGAVTAGVWAFNVSAPQTPPINKRG